MPRLFKIAAYMFMAVVALASPCGAGDPSPEPQKELVRLYTLPSALKRALAENKNIKAAETDSDAADAGIGRSRGQLLPQVRASMSVSRLDSTKDETWHTDYQDQASNNRKISVRQVLFDMPAFSRYQTATLEKERADLYLKSTQLEIMHRTETEYFTLLSAKENVKSYEKAVERMERQVESALAFYERQMKPRLHVLQMKTQLAKANSQLTEAVNQVENQRATLLSILSLPQSEKILFTGDLHKTKVRELDEFSTYLSHACAQRPDAIIRKKDIEIAAKNADTARSSFLPTVSASADYNKYDIDYDRRLRDKYHEYFTIGLDISWDIFSGLGTYYDTQQQEKLTQSAKLRYEKLLEDIATQVKNSYNTTVQYKKQIIRSLTYVEEAQETYNRADKAYRLGIGTSTDLVDASRTLVDAEVSLNMAYADYNKALSTLYYTSGDMKSLRQLADVYSK